MKLFLSFVILFFLATCQSDKNILGKWRLVEIDFSEHLSTLRNDERADFESIIKRQSSMLDQTFYNFMEDSILQVITPKKNDTGQIMQIEKWGLSKNQDSLIIINAEKELFHLKKHDDFKMILTSKSTPKRRLVLVKVE